MGTLNIKMGKTFNKSKSNAKIFKEKEEKDHLKK